MALNISDKNFENEVLKSDKPVLVDFWASWCQPCKMMGPVIEELSEEHKEYKFCKVNVDENERLAYEYKIMSIPCFMVFKNGKLVNQTVGVTPKEELLALLG